VAGASRLEDLGEGGLLDGGGYTAPCGARPSAHRDWRDHDAGDRKCRRCVRKPKKLTQAELDRSLAKVAALRTRLAEIEQWEREAGQAGRR
jgi:hypothetical protein